MQIVTYNLHKRISSTDCVMLTLRLPTLGPGIEYLYIESASSVPATSLNLGRREIQ